MTNQEIFELMDRFERSGLTSMKVTLGDCALELSRAVSVAAPVHAAAPVLPSAPAPAAQEEELCIRAPLVGTFYAAPAPGETPFVRPGDKVEKGQTVCLIEAMKMMSEVKAPCDCVIDEVLQENGALLAFDAPIFRYRAV